MVYDEYSGRHYTTNTRAFFLRQNLKPLDEHARPYFVSTNLAGSLPPVPVFVWVMNNAPEIVLLSSQRMAEISPFFLKSRRESGFDPLPFYNDGIGRLERTAGPPLTVTADLTIVGGVLAIICWDVLA